MSFGLIEGFVLMAWGRVRGLGGLGWASGTYGFPIDIFGWAGAGKPRYKIISSIMRVCKDSSKASAEGKPPFCCANAVS